MAALGADRIVYLSCDPATLARDLALIREVEPDYRLESAVGFDLFPQTPHVEALVVLERNSPGGAQK
jgi:23S rRNA (uracil1939-C5)-methyltransferase